MNLSYVQSNCRFSVPQVKSIIFQLLMVLDYLHSHPQRFVHRDLKCANLLLTDDNVLKLGDFGLARSLIVHDPAAKLSNLVITLWYRAPEVLLGSTEYTGAVDMWSVGCILLELLTGRPAFPAKAEAEQVKNIIRVIGTPAEGSYLRNLPFWSRFTIDDTKPQLTEWLQRHDAFKDAELLHLITRMLEGDPNRRVTAREALGAKWFASAPRIDKDSPNAG
jgi:serine/threonine protein kinase